MERNYKIDNAKGVMILLVVLGHFLEITAGWQSASGRLIMEVIFMVHMPAFIFMAGMTFNKHKWKIRTVQIIFLYIVFQSVYSAYFIHNGTMSMHEYLTTPYWLLWFLASLASFYLICGLINPSKKFLVLSVLFSAVAGAATISSYEFSWLRTVVFLPFFVAGYILKDSYAFEKKSFRLPRIVGLAAVLLTIYFSVNYKLWFGVYRFSDMGYGLTEGITMRFFALIASMSLIFLTLTSAPNRLTTLTKIGQSSLSIYAIHGFFVIAAGKFIAHVTIISSGYSFFLYAILLTALVVAFIVMLPFEGAIRRIMGLPARLIGK